MDAVVRRGLLRLEVGCGVGGCGVGVWASCEIVARGVGSHADSVYLKDLLIFMLVGGIFVEIMRLLFVGGSA